ncbi:MAG: hypothetical protein DI582_00835 [Azospirillum brasilense]|nr:MAG: hypothetical protein DI582_00835 [Azospirillum brasilense]
MTIDRQLFTQEQQAERALELAAQVKDGSVDARAAQLQLMDTYGMGRVLSGVLLRQATRELEAASTPSR